MIDLARLIGWPKGDLQTLAGVIFEPGGPFQAHFARPVPPCFCPNPAL